MPLILGLFLLFILLYAIARNQITRKEKETEEAFWEKERRANHTPKKDISNLAYITIPLDSFPLGKHQTEGILELESVLTQLSEKKIFSCNGMTNTELKLEYGTANFTFLSECDEHYTQLIRTLMDYAKLLTAEHHTEDAITVLEYGLSIRSDISENYTLLATLYSEKGEKHRIRSLIEIAGALTSPNAESIQRKLSDML